MSLSELTRNAFQSGLSAYKWLSLCKLYIEKYLAHATRLHIESDLSNSVLVLFRDYPGDPALRDYLRLAIQDGALSLDTFISTFLSQSMNFDRLSTLDMLCRLAINCRFSAKMSSTASVSLFGQPQGQLTNLHYAVGLLHTAYLSTSTHFHPLTESASELFLILLEDVNQDSQISSHELSPVLSGMQELLIRCHVLPDGLRQVLENYTMSYAVLLQDERATRQAQVMHTLQMAIGQGDIAGANLMSTDTVMCGLILHACVSRRANDFGSGDGHRAVVSFIALARWASWIPSTFCTQVLRTAAACFAQATTSASSRHTTLWRAFVIGRLPRLLLMFEEAADMDSTSKADWRSAMQIAVQSLLHQSELVMKCDTVYQQNPVESSGNYTPFGPFMLELVHQLSTSGLLDPAFAASLYPAMQNEFHPKIQAEAQEHGQELETYLESLLGMDTSVKDATDMVEKIWRDPCCHSVFAEVVQKRFKSYPSSHDIEPLGHICSILLANDHILDVLALHLRIQYLLAQALLIVEDYDCETVGDPQAAVTSYGNVVLFVQMALAKYNLAGSKFNIGDRVLSASILEFASSTRTLDEQKADDVTMIMTWQKTLFDKGNEGIDDSILRNTRPRNLLRVAATLLSHSVIQCVERKLDKDTLIMGLSFFLGPLLNWTLVGVITAILRDIQRKAFLPPVTLHIEVLQTLLQSPTCPAPVLRLCAPLMLRVLPTTKIQVPQAAIARGVVPFDPLPLRKLALQALGEPSEDTGSALSIHPTPVDPVVNAIQESITSAQQGKAPALDVDRCLLFSSPAKFLSSLWAQVSIHSTTGDLEAPRRIATFVLSMPRSPRSPPLLPVFLHTVLPSIITAADQLVPAEQTLAVELIVGVVSSALTAALFVDAALLSVEKQKEQRMVLGQPALTMARRLSADLRRRTRSPTSSMVMQRLTSSASFIANFPTFTTDL